MCATTGKQHLKLSVLPGFLFLRTLREDQEAGGPRSSPHPRGRRSTAGGGASKEAVETSVGARGLIYILSLGPSQCAALVSQRLAGVTAVTQRAVFGVIRHELPFTPKPGGREGGPW